MGFSGSWISGNNEPSVWTMAERHSSGICSFLFWTSLFPRLERIALDHVGKAAALQPLNIAACGHAFTFFRVSGAIVSDSVEVSTVKALRTVQTSQVPRLLVG